MIKVEIVRFLLIYLLVLSNVSRAALIDLTDYCQDFVLQTKQIHIPGYPGAFNASVIRWQNSLLMCFRVRDTHMRSTFQVGCVWLDEEFNPISRPQILKIKDTDSSFNQNQDPRLIVIQGKLHILYCNFTKIDDFVTRRMFVAQMQQDGDTFFVENPLCLNSSFGSLTRWQKNWTPFNYQDSLLLAYSQNPHIILKPSYEDGYCQTVSSTQCNIHWPWGVLRGGTPAILDEGKYISFFHSSQEMETVHSDGKKMSHYVMGAYRFSSEPPFAVTDISPLPIVEKNFYNAPAYPTWKPLRVVFPMGIIAEKEYIWITYGRQDFEIWVAQLDKKRLYESLMPCSHADIEQAESISTKAITDVSVDENIYDIS